MNHTQLQSIGAQLRQRRDSNRIARERAERRDGFRLLGLGLLAGVVVVAVLAFAMAG